MPIPTETYERISGSNLQFDRIPIIMISSTGIKYIRWVSIGMPKIPEKIIDCAFYLYPNREEAELGEKVGGTGFLAGVSSETFPHHPQYQYIYGVTNWHVIHGNMKNPPCPVIRLNKKDGGIEIFEFKIEDWLSPPKDHQDDIAISPQIPLDPNVHKFTYIHTSLLFNDVYNEQCKIGVGDNVFMVGRFLGFDGGITNLPSARFGHISVMPTPIKQPTGYIGDSYCIDLNSRTGYSGSPVFVYRTPADNLEEAFRTKKPFAEIHFFLYLLGIHWGQFKEEYPIEHYGSPIESHAIGGSGMTLVIPAQRIYELLCIKAIRDKRIIEGDKILYEHFKRKGRPPTAESAKHPSYEENPQHKEHFNSLLTAAVKKKPQADET